MVRNLEVAKWIPAQQDPLLDHANTTPPLRQATNHARTSGLIPIGARILTPYPVNIARVRRPQPPKQPARAVKP